MTETPNGLASLTHARDRRVRRTMPPTRNPVAIVDTTGDASAGPVTDHASASARADNQLEESRTRQVVIRNDDDARSGRSDPSTTNQGGGLLPTRPVTVYLDSSHVDLLEQVRIAGLIDRVDISKSAVVRLALARLREDMTTDEIKSRLKAQPTDPHRTGRKRR